MAKYRRKPTQVDAYQLVDNDWLVIEDGRQEIYTPKEFAAIFEEELLSTSTGSGVDMGGAPLKRDITPNAISPLGGVTVVDPSKL